MIPLAPFVFADDWFPFSTDASDIGLALLAAGFVAVVVGVWFGWMHGPD